jgi:hypothetical protein
LNQRLQRLQKHPLHARLEQRRMLHRIKKAVAFAAGQSLRLEWLIGALFVGGVFFVFTDE